MNPLIFRKGVCDPHIHIFEGKAYLYATHDAPGYTEGFCMEDWQIWSSEDLIDWKLERTVYPEEFYCGKLDQCWAVDAACRDGKYYLYFSTGDWGVGVAVADHPAGPFVDALGCALADYNTYPENIQKWDPHVFQDDDGEAYLILGTCLQEKPWNCYLIARLKEDMIHLAEPFRKIEYMDNPCPEDKPSLHKYHGKYYLTHASYYAVADQVYGLYVHRGHIGFTNDHGAFFTYRNQTYFGAGGMDNPNRYMRASYVAPCHYRKCGDIVIEQEIAAYGCGQYDAAWERIYAKWYFEAARECKTETKDGDFHVTLLDGEHLYFPEILNLEENTKMQIAASSREEAEITVREDSPDGRVLGRCVILGRPDQEISLFECRLSCSAGKKSLYLSVRGEVEIGWFSFDNGKKRCTAQPALSKRGRGACLFPDKNAGNHLGLKNLELRGAGLEVCMDGGKGGAAYLTVSYRCTEGQAESFLCVNGGESGRIAFSETEKDGSGEPKQVRIPVKARAGLNRIGLWTKEYQAAKPELFYLTLETEKTCCRVYPAAGGTLFPAGNGCWDGLPQWETEPSAYSGRIVKYLDKPGYGVKIDRVDGGSGGIFGLEIHYRCKEREGSDYELLVNGASLGICRFPYTGESMVDMENLYAEIALKPGAVNELCLKKAEGSGEICLDAFAVVPAI